MNLVAYQSKGNPSKKFTGKECSNSTNCPHNHDEETNNDHQDWELSNARVVHNLKIDLIVDLHTSNINNLCPYCKTVQQLESLFAFYITLTSTPCKVAVALSPGHSHSQASNVTRVLPRDKATYTWIQQLGESTEFCLAGAVVVWLWTEITQQCTLSAQWLTFAHIPTTIVANPSSCVHVCVWVCVCVCVCVCEWERERESVCVCACIVCAIIVTLTM